MNKIKNLLYVIGAIVLIIKIFFRDDISKGLDNVLWLLCGILVLIIIFLEVLTRRK